MPITDEGIKKMGSICTLEYYSHTGRHERAWEEPEEVASSWRVLQRPWEGTGALFSTAVFPQCHVHLPDDLCHLNSYIFTFKVPSIHNK